MKRPRSDRLPRKSSIAPRNTESASLFSPEQLRSELGRGLAAHQAGRVEEALGVYQSVLDVVPDEPDTNRLLGIAAHQLQRHDEALAALLRAVAARPDFAAAHFSCGIVLLDLGRLDAAAECFSEAVRLRPQDPEAHVNLGIVRRRQGRVQDAEDQFRAALGLHPAHVEALNDLGSVLLARGDIEDARHYLEAALQLRPRFVAALLNLARVYRALQLVAEACDAVFAVLEMAPAHVDAADLLRQFMAEPHTRRKSLERLRLRAATSTATEAVSSPCDLKKDAYLPGYDAFIAYGRALLECGEHRQAERELREAAPKRTEMGLCDYTLALVLAAQQRFSEAKVMLERLLDRGHRFHGATFFELGRILSIQGEYPAAKEAFERSLGEAPEGISAQLGIAALLAHDADLEGAEMLLRRVLARSPESVPAGLQLASLLMNQRRLGDAHHCLRGLLEAAPQHATAHAFIATIYRQWGCHAQAHQHFRAAVAAGAGADVHSELLCTLVLDADSTAESLHVAHRQWASAHAAAADGYLAAAIAAESGEACVSDLLQPVRRVRIGYVSGDFRTHAVTHFFRPLLAHHDRARFEIYCYSNTPASDDMTARLRSSVEHWRDIRGLSDNAVFELIRDDRIDVLVDLSGHSPENRLLLFARRAAMVQVTYLGYPCTTGLDAMDYRLTDEFADPIPNADRFASERLVRLPDGFLCYQAPDDAPAVAARDGDSGVTLACFNTFAKVTERVLETWSAILSAVDGRLLLKDWALTDPGSRAMVEARLSRHEIDLGQVELLDWIPSKRAHLAKYGGVDIALDTWPYNGTTTTCEAMWMGVPVVTLAGETHASRVGLSLMAAVGLTDLVASDPEGYVRLVVALARDRNRLGKLRDTLRSRVASSPLCDGARFTSHVEAAYLDMLSGHARVASGSS